VTGTVDLFDPPLHIRAIAACLAAKEADPKMGIKRIAKRTGFGRMVVTMALRCAKRMKEEGLSEPYRELTEPPTSVARWRLRGAS
jgi:hypothetical protein